LENFSNYNVQEAVLGTFLAHGYEVWNYAKDIKPKMFDKEPDALIYSAIHECSLQGLEPNALIIRQILKDKDQLEQAGGESYLDVLVDSRQPPKNMATLVNQVQNNYKARRLREINARLPELLENSSNVNETISRLHADLEKMVSEVGSPDVSKLSETIAETIQKILERRENPGIRGISTGMTEVDNYTSGFNPGSLWYIGARPSHGKSAWLIKTAMEVAKQGEGVLLFNREMGPDDINERIISIISKVPLQSIRLGTIKEEHIRPLERAQKVVEKMPIYVDNNFTRGIDYIIATIRKYHQLYDIKVVGIDYIQLIVERSTESVHLLGAASRSLKLLANELGITIIILSQLNREVEKRDDRRPLMGDLRQSGNMEEDADIMIALYRDEMYVPHSPAAGTLEFIIRKSRNGPTGFVSLRFDDETVNITDNSLDSWDEEGII
jgi:replicative DNA helicase